MNTHDVIELLWERKGRGTSKQLAKSLGVSQAFLSDVFSGRRDVGSKIPRALGLVKLPDTFIQAKSEPKPARGRK